MLNNNKLTFTTTSVITTIVVIFTFQRCLSCQAWQIPSTTGRHVLSPSLTKSNLSFPPSHGKSKSTTRMHLSYNSNSFNNFGRPLVNKKDINIGSSFTSRSTLCTNIASKHKFINTWALNAQAINEDDKSVNKEDIVDPVKDAFDATVSKPLNQVNIWWKENCVDRIPTPVLEFFQSVLNFWKRIQWILLSFLTGAVVGGIALLVPFMYEVESINPPVTLFETILGDLQEAYVDEVDTQKLFETGVSAMLASLDPYTEFEGKQQAAMLTESIDGKYGGVGLVISGNNANIAKTRNSVTITNTPAASQLLPNKAQEDKVKLDDKSSSSTLNIDGSTNNNEKKENLRTSSTSSSSDDNEEDEDVDEYFAKSRLQNGIRVVSAFEGYAFDYGMRVGDRLVQIDGNEITDETTVDQVRDALRGSPGTWVNIQFERDGVPGLQSIDMPRAVVRIRDVKLATLLGDPRDGIGYVQLSGFASEAGAEMRQAIRMLQQASEDASNGEHSLQGLVLDMRGNPGGLLTSAVDVASLLVPKDSDIVSAKGRGFPSILYRSRVDPLLDPTTRLAVLVNGNTASAAEIVSGAIQDLDVGIIVGSDRTFGKGLVQNVEELPFDTALKYTVAKYYTPSGRCIQGVNYKEGGGANGRYSATKVADSDRQVYFTKHGRIVKDGGGIEADYKVEGQKASALEITLLRAGVFSDYAAEWSKTHELTNDFKVDEETYKNFQAFVKQKQQAGELKLEALYSKPLSDLKKALKRSGYNGAEKEVEALQANIKREVEKDFEKYRADIKEDISQNILARYLPESMLIERGVQNDKQVEATVKLLKNSSSKFEKILARDTSADSKTIDGGMYTMTMSSTDPEKVTVGSRTASSGNIYC